MDMEHTHQHDHVLYLGAVMLTVFIDTMIIITVNRTEHIAGASKFLSKHFLISSVASRFLVMVLACVPSSTAFDPWIDGVLFFDWFHILFLIWSLSDVFKPFQSIIVKVDYRVVTIVSLLYQVFAMTNWTTLEIHEYRSRLMFVNITSMYVAIGLMIIKIIKEGLEFFVKMVTLALHPKDQFALTIITMRIVFYYCVISQTSTKEAVLLLFASGIIHHVLLTHQFLLLNRAIRRNHHTAYNDELHNMYARDEAVDISDDEIENVGR